jgi:hypothetical protein
VLLKIVRSLTAAALLIFSSWSPARATEQDDLEHAREAAHNQQYGESFKTLKHLAACQHCTTAECLVGLMYQRGTGVKKNPHKAAAYYKKSARKGFPDAQYRLGSMYLAGKDIQKDATQAERWLTKAAEQGVAEAQTHLGKAYLDGNVLKKDEQKARRYLYLARDQGAEDAQKLLDRIPGADQALDKAEITGHQAAQSYGRGLGYVEQSWQGYGDLVQSVESVAKSASQ